MIGSVRNIYRGNSILDICFRHLSSTEVSTALRPFYFSVHPDLFGQYPNERAVNESSLQQLSSILANIQASRPVRPMSLSFYIKDKTKEAVNFRLVKIHLRERDIRSSVITILKSCDLSTDYVDSITNHVPPKKPEFKFRYENDIDLTNVDENHPIYAHVKMQRNIWEAQEAQKLKNYLSKNYVEALKKSERGDIYRKEITRLKTKIMAEMGVKDVHWDCGWNVSHFRGCLLSFLSLVEHHPKIKSALEGRILVFSFFTGVSLDGHVMLFSGEVRHNWLDVSTLTRIKNILFLREKCIVCIYQNVEKNNSHSNTCNLVLLPWPPK